MTSTFAPTVYAIDFGTTNSLLGAANAEEVTAAVPLDPGAPDATVLRTVLYLPTATTRFIGHQAIREYVARGMEGRLLRSVKRHLPSPLFSTTTIDGRPFRLEDLVGAFLRDMRERANAHFGVDVRSVVLGRPARFSEDDACDNLAAERLTAAANLAGFDTVRLCPEPLAAARAYRERATTTKLAFIADLGGGTSDFTVVRIGPSPFVPEDVLAIGGVPTAGDAYDASLMRGRIASHFGADVTYRAPMGSNVMPMPPSILNRLCSPAELSLLQRADVVSFLAMVRRGALEPEDREALDWLGILASDALGFDIFEAIEQTKRGLSEGPTADFAFDYPPIEIQEHIARTDFEEWSARETDKILGTLDQTLANAGVTPGDIDLVCCTGGTARIPHVAAAIAARFGTAHIEQYKTFHSVVEGLAHEARSMAQNS